VQLVLAHFPGATIPFFIKNRAKKQARRDKKSNESGIGDFDET